METLESIFSTDNNNVEILKGYAYKPDYKKLFFEHLGPELRKLYMNKKDKLFINKFLEASQYEYGFFDNKIDLQKAFNLYKKYADLNDYFCMYKMHIIYLCEYEKFNVTFSRVLEKIYLLKCLAYLPNYIYDWDINLFDKIDVLDEVARILDLEDPDLSKHRKFFDLLIQEREKYNLSENDINLMKGVLICYFTDENDLLSFSILNSINPKKETDYTYYLAKNKAIFFSNYLKLGNEISDLEIEQFYKEIENKKIYELYADYGNYLLDKKNRANSEIINIFKEAADNGYLFNSFRMYQCLIDFYSFDEIMEDYNKASLILDYLLDEIVFENIANKPFILLMGFLIKYSKFPDKIISKYLIYVKEINDYVSSTIQKKEENKIKFLEEDEYLYVIKGYIHIFGFKDIEEQNLGKVIEYLDKGSNVTQKIYIKKNNEYIKYRIINLMHELNLLSNDEFNKSRKDIIKFFLNNLKLKNEINDCYIIGEDYFEGITKKIDKTNTFYIYKSSLDIFCKSMSECKTKSDIRKFLKNHENINENKLKDEICCICYTNKVNKIFIPCKHNFCDFCVNKLEKGAKCPICRSEILCVI